MTDLTKDKEDLKEKAKQMAIEGKTISKISEELGISWNEARSYMPGWQGAKVKITNRLNNLATEPNQAKRGKWLLRQIDMPISSTTLPST